jgi:UDP-GlcNAc:undecaprenyl-phosphate/decaprenyl-phosphate GlcNAc-1-phosphate transferase
MMPTLPLYPFAALLAGLALSLMLVPAVRWLSFRTGKVASPRKDRWHSQPTPSLGGIGMFFAYAIVVLGSTALTGSWGQVQWGLLAGSLLMFALGTLDDFKQLSPPAKLVGQFLAAAIVIYFGRTINFFPWGFANIILTFFWLVGITNAINLLDNMDGLAGGVVMIASAFLAYFFIRAGNYPLAALALALVGVVLGFLVFNFPPARIFMGDSGSMFLGFTLAALAVAHRPRASDVFTVIGVPTLLLLLPIVDTTLVTITRLLRGQSPAQGGTDHTSHRLIAFGFSERQAVLFLYAIGIVSGVTGAVLEALDYDLSLVLIPLLLISLALLTAYLGRIKMVTTVAPATGISRIMADLTYRRRIFEIVLDFFLIGLAYYLAFYIHYGFGLEGEQMEIVLQSIPLAVSSGFLCFFLFGVYRGLWRYQGMDDLIRYFKASAGTALAAALMVSFFQPQVAFQAEIFLLFGVFLFILLSGSRISFRMLDRLYNSQRSGAKSSRVLIYGTDDAGELTLQWLQRSPRLGLIPVGFIDDDHFNHGRRIHGVPVLGSFAQLNAILARQEVDGIILTCPLGPDEGMLRKLEEAARTYGLWVKTLRLDFEPLISGNA